MEKKQKINKKLLFISLVLLVIGLLSAFSYSVFHISSYKLKVDNQILFCDNNSYSYIKIICLNPLGYEVKNRQVKSKISITEGNELIDIILLNEATSELRLKSKLNEGNVKIHFKPFGELYTFEIDVKIVKNLADNSESETPSWLVLDNHNDITNFRKWFVNIALSQFYKEDQAWVFDQKDCAGLLRFSYKEALRKHDKKWFNARSFLFDPGTPDVRKYNYPDVPFLGDKIFRISSGKITKENISEKYSVFADAKTLLRYSLFFYQEIYRT